jgi:hypothetical protein
MVTLAGSHPTRIWTGVVAARYTSQRAVGGQGRRLEDLRRKDGVPYTADYDGRGEPRVRLRKLL